MTGRSVGVKVHVEMGGRSLPGVVVSHAFASNGRYDRSQRCVLPSIAIWHKGGRSPNTARCKSPGSPEGRRTSQS